MYICRGISFVFLKTYDCAQKAFEFVRNICESTQTHTCVAHLCTNLCKRYINVRDISVNVCETYVKICENIHAWPFYL